MASNPQAPFIPNPNFPQQGQQPQPVQQPLQQAPLPPYYGPQTPRPQQPQQMPTRQTVSGDEVLDGPGVPIELRGRKLSDAMRLYNALASDFVQRQRAAAGVPKPQSSPQPQQQQPTPGPSGDFWQNPDDRITSIVRQVVNEAVGPFTQQNQSSAITAAKEQAKQTVPDFQELEADIMQIVSGSNAESLGKVDYWENAADLARGRRARAGQRNPNPEPQSGSQDLIFSPNVRAAPTPNQPYPQATPPANHGQPVPAGVNPQVPQFPTTRPPSSQFFSEAPTAPSPYQNTHSASLSPAELQVASLAGMSPEQYAAWKSIQTRGR